MDKDDILNILFHVLILFTFLTIFFFTYISTTEKNATQDAINNIINNQSKSILSEIDNLDKKIGGKIDWDKFKEISENIVNSNTDYDKTTDGESIKDNNNNVFWTSIYIIIALVVIIVAYIIWNLYYKHEKLKIGEILKDNFIIFMFVGTIEFLFFVYIVSKYIPTTPDIIGITAIEKIKENIDFASS
jgi:hypothetical protein